MGRNLAPRRPVCGASRYRAIDSATAAAAAAGSSACVTGRPITRTSAPASMAASGVAARAWSWVGDPARAATPEAAMEAGADVLVIGRPVTHADDPAAAAAAVAQSITA